MYISHNRAYLFCFTLQVAPASDTAAVDAISTPDREAAAAAVPATPGVHSRPLCFNDLYRSSKKQRIEHPLQPQQLAQGG
jgi:hypothetical protein